MLRGRGVVGAVTGVDMSACVMCLECTAVGLATSAASSDGAAEERRGVRGSLSRRRLTPEYGGIRPRWMSATGLVIPSCSASRTNTQSVKMTREESHTAEGRYN